MYGSELFNQWSPPYSIWTPWAKPSLFAQISTATHDTTIDTAWKTMNIAWAPSASERTALIVDLPGDAPLLTGLALAHKGYSPVVLYNCCRGQNAVIDLGQCVSVLCNGSEALRDVVLAPDAPPVFLLDSRRKLGDRAPMPGLFDNRWMILPQDFPSATFLLSHKIQQVAYIQSEAGQPAMDLAHVLLRWQQAGIRILNLQVGNPPAEIQIKRPWRFGYAWYALLAMLNFRPNSAGGFGSIVPMPSQSSGWG